MSNSKNAIQEIKSLMVKFGFLAEEASLLSFKLEDNTILQAEKLEAGESIVKINEAFEQVALENGTFKLVENFEIEVENGKITSVKEIFVDAKLVDGTVVKVEGDGLVEGAKVVVVTEEAEIPAPDGVHELEDGTKIETKDGIISKIEEAMAEGEGDENSPVAEDEAKKAAEVLEPSLAMESEIVGLLKDLVIKLGDKIAELEGKVGEMSSDFNEFKKQPAARPIANGKTDFNKSNAIDDVDAKIATIMAMRNQNN
jgi:hypothetical protein